jgi:hypothetical protein
MAWVRIDDHFDDHPKVVQAGPLGLAMYVAGLCYCNRNLTDGYIPAGQVARLVSFDGLYIDVQGSVGGIDRPDAFHVAEDLVACGLWEPADEGYCIHDYLKYQPSRADIEAERERKSRAGKASVQSRFQHTVKHSVEQAIERSVQPDPDPVPDLNTNTEENTSSSQATKDFPEESDEYRLSCLLRSLILSNRPTAKVPQNLQGWCKQFDLILRVDKRSPPEVETVIEWCQRDLFWRSNILSPKKLREKYDTLALQMKRGAKGGQALGSAEKDYTFGNSN